MQYIKLKDWAIQHGYSYMGAYKAYRAGRIAGAFQQGERGAVLVPVTNNTETGAGGNASPTVFTYSRVSSAKQKADLDRQKQRLNEFCFNKGLSVAYSYSEVASGLNDSRRELSRLIDKVKKQPASILVIEHKDRLTRFGYNYLERLFTELNCQIIVVNATQTDEQDLVADLSSVIYSFCAKLYAKRKAANKAKQVVSIIYE